MWLTGIEFRVKEYHKGWVVEVKKRKWYGKYYWTHIESVSGMSKKPWYYKTKEIAISEAKKHFEWDLIKSIVKNERISNKSN